MKTAWSPPDPIEILINRLFNGTQFVEETGDTMEDSALTRTGYNTIADNGLFQQAYYEWRKLIRVEQSWAKFKTHFTAADKDRVNNKTLQDAGYHNVNNATIDTTTVATSGTTNSETTSTSTSTISTLTEAISLHTTTSQANFTKMLEILEKSATKISTLRTGPRNGRPLSHCWTHGCSDNTSHTGATCTNKKEGHIEEATWENKMGGSEKYYSKKE